MTQQKCEFNQQNPSLLLFASSAAFLLVAGLNLSYLWLHLPQVGQLDSYHWGMQDFRDAVYFPCQALREGVNPYDVSAYTGHFEGRVGNIFPLYSPLLLVLFFPLAFLPFSAAIWVFQVINLVLLLVCCRLTLRWCGWESSAAAVLTLGAIVLASEPARSNQIWGQLSWPLVLGTYLALALAGKHPAWSGVAVGLASLKPTYLVTLVFFLLFRRDFKAVAFGIGFTVSGALAGLGLMAACGVNILELPQVALSNQAALLQDPGVEPSTTLARVDLPVLLGKVFGIGSGSWLNYALPIGIMLSTGWLVHRETSHAENSAPDSMTTLLICLASLVAIYHHVYELVLLTLPGVAMFTARHPSWMRIPTWGLALLRTGTIILAINIAWTGPGVRLAKIIAEVWPTVLVPWGETGLQIATSINSATIAGMWLVAVVGCLWPRQESPVAGIAVASGKPAG